MVQEHSKFCENSNAIKYNLQIEHNKISIIFLMKMKKKIKTHVKHRRPGTYKAITQKNEQC